MSPGKETPPRNVFPSIVDESASWRVHLPAVLSAPTYSSPMVEKVPKTRASLVCLKYLDRFPNAQNALPIVLNQIHERL